MDGVGALKKLRDRLIYSTKSVLWWPPNKKALLHLEMESHFWKRDHYRASL